MKCGIETTATASLVPIQVASSGVRMLPMPKQMKSRLTSGGSLGSVGNDRVVAAVCTSDLGRALRLTGQLEAGMIRVNAPTSGVDFHAPFGGAKESSYGPREQGLAARDFYTESQTVLIMP